MRTLTLEDHRKIELMWRRNASPVKIAAELEISQCTVYTELKRGQATVGDGDVVLDENFRPAYSAERGEAVYKRNNPTWWLMRGGKPGEVPELSINIKAAFPILWGKE